ncbi:MAG TPA: PTS sugar transporter subunit IIA [Xanthomonadaceae bacterium]|nr:PTS sugar transporter subunit IIA [Xanthomonadaceae bacterium]
MPLHDLLASDRIALLVEPGSRDTVLDTAARLLADGSANNTAALAAALREREQLGSTGIGHGIAIPHGRTNAFDRARGAFLRLREPVEFDASDGQPVDLVFALAVPRHFNREHLQVLSDLALRFSDPAFRAALRDARDIAALRLLLLAPEPVPQAATLTD